MIISQFFLSQNIYAQLLVGRDKNDLCIFPNILYKGFHQPKGRLHFLQTTRSKRTDVYGFMLIAFYFFRFFIIKKKILQKSFKTKTLRFVPDLCSNIEV